ncbi:MAG: transcription antitermination factor NusB [Paludibacter sp.]|jgi:N utilization substance protein B|nr:transcription antitermination factor NusB [Paludibacter sp.]
MINRVLLRIRIIQVLYSLNKNSSKSAAAAEKELLHNLERTYDLYFHLLNLIILITNYAEGRIEARRNRLLPSKEDLNPNTRFINNQFVKQLASNKQLKEYLAKRKLSWADNQDITKSLFNEIEQSDCYLQYINATGENYEDDKMLWRNIFKQIIANNDNLEESLEEQCIYWIDLLGYISGFIDKSIKFFDLENGAFQELQPMFRDEEDSDFARKLIKKTIDEQDILLDIIDKHLKNWELDRVSIMDILIMQTAVAELTDFPTIPINVTLNEYIEIARYYSSEKSPTFMNGILDSIVKELKNDNKLIKVVTFNKDED